jgi:hypothetical protein
MICAFAVLGTSVLGALSVNGEPWLAPRGGCTEKPPRYATYIALAATAERRR